MTSYTIVICTEPYKFEATDSMINLAKAIIAKGNSIKGIFLYASGVYNMKKDIDTGNHVRDLPQKLSDFAKENNIPIAGCQTWIGLAGIKEDTYIENSKNEGLGELSNWSAESDKLIVFGTGV